MSAFYSKIKEVSKRTGYTVEDVVRGLCEINNIKLSSNSEVKRTISTNPLD